MRYWIGFVVFALAVAPVAAQGQQGANVSPMDPWLRLQLNEPEGLRVSSFSRPSLAYIPEDLEKRLPQHRHPTPSSVEEGTPEGTPATDTADDRTPEAEPYKVDPDLSPSWLRRMHPGAFEAPAKSSDSRFEIEYATPAGAAQESRPGLSRPARIAIGVVVPLVVLTGIAAAVTVSAFNNMELF